MAVDVSVIGGNRIERGLDGGHERVRPISEAAQDHHEEQPASPRVRTSHGLGWFWRLAGNGCGGRGMLVCLSNGI